MKSRQQQFDVNRIPSQPKRRKKITLVFDEEKRKEFLTGFRKRKLERKKKAEEELKGQLKEEKKKIKQDVHEKYKKMLSQRDIPELQEFLSKSEYETENHKVSVLELDVAEISKGCIGINKTPCRSEDELEEEALNGEESNNDSDTEIAGMELKKKKSKSEQLKDSDSAVLTSKKELKQALKQTALKQVQQSKAFKQKKELERRKNKKLSKQERIKHERKMFKLEKMGKRKKVAKLKKKIQKKEKQTGKKNKKH